MKEQLEAQVKKWEGKREICMQERELHLFSPFIYTDTSAVIRTLNQCINEVKSIIEQNEKA